MEEKEPLLKHTVSKESDNNYYIRRNGVVMQCARQKVPLTTITEKGQGFTFTFCSSNCPLFTLHNNPNDKNQLQLGINCGAEKEVFAVELVDSPEPKPVEVVTNKDKTKAVVPTGQGGEA